MNKLFKTSNTRRAYRLFKVAEGETLRFPAFWERAWGKLGIGVMRLAYKNVQLLRIIGRLNNSILDTSYEGIRDASGAGVQGKSLDASARVRLVKSVRKLLTFTRQITNLVKGMSMAPSGKSVLKRLEEHLKGRASLMGQIISGGKEQAGFNVQTPWDDFSDKDKLNIILKGLKHRVVTVSGDVVLNKILVDIENMQGGEAQFIADNGPFILKMVSDILRGPQKKPKTSVLDRVLLLEVEKYGYNLNDLYLRAVKIRDIEERVLLADAKEAQSALNYIYGMGWISAILAKVEEDSSDTVKKLVGDIFKANKNQYFTLYEQQLHKGIKSDNIAQAINDFARFIQEAQHSIGPAMTGIDALLDELGKIPPETGATQPAATGAKSQPGTAVPPPPTGTGASQPAVPSGTASPPSAPPSQVDVNQLKTLASTAKSDCETFLTTLRQELTNPDLFMSLLDKNIKYVTPYLEAALKIMEELTVDSDPASAQARTSYTEMSTKLQAAQTALQSLLQRLKDLDDQSVLDKFESGEKLATEALSAHNIAASEAVRVDFSGNEKISSLLTSIQDWFNDNDQLMAEVYQQIHKGTGELGMVTPEDWRTTSATILKLKEEVLAEIHSLLNIQDKHGDKVQPPTATP